MHGETVGGGKWIFIDLWISSTCFGQSFAHFQECKTVVYSYVVYCPNFVVGWRVGVRYHKLCVLCEGCCSALCGGIVLEEALDLSSDRILNEWMNEYVSTLCFSIANGKTTVSEQNGSTHSMNLNFSYPMEWYKTQNMHHITHWSFLFVTISLANI